MSKKLKKKVEEICGLNGLSWEARQARASLILASSEWKQTICNDLIGLSFRELEQTLSGIVFERQKKEDSYEHKLKAYQTGKADKRPKPLQRDFSEPTNTHINRQPTHKSRTLDEILAQVYAPRVVQHVPKNGRSFLHSFQTADEPSDEVPSGSSNGNDCPEE